MQTQRIHGVAVGSLLSCFVIAALSIGAMAAPPTGVVVRNEKQLRAALTNQQPQIVIASSFFINAPLPNITKPVSIKGDASTCFKQKNHWCRLDMRRRYRHFLVSSGGSLTLFNLYLSRGRSLQSGGSILVTNGGRLTVSRVLFKYNKAQGVISGGGALEVQIGGVANITDSSFIRNTAGFGGAIAAANNATVKVLKSNFHRNNATSGGGAISAILSSSVSVSASTFTYNLSPIGPAIQADASRCIVCRPLSYGNNGTLYKQYYFAANKAHIVACGVAPILLKPMSGGVVTSSCALCSP